jgi:hypothetical protein
MRTRVVVAWRDQDWDNEGRGRPASRTVHAVNSTTHPPAPTAAELAGLADGARRLLAEVDTALCGSAFGILNNQTPGTIHRYYDAAALRHCCLLLRDIEICSEAGQEMTVRILGRVFMEAWLVALYIHFGGYEALRRVAQNTAHHVALVDRGLKDFDALIERAKERALGKARNRIQGKRRDKALEHGEPVAASQAASCRA